MSDGAEDGSQVYRRTVLIGVVGALAGCSNVVGSDNDNGISETEIQSKLVESDYIKKADVMKVEGAGYNLIVQPTEPNAEYLILAVRSTALTVLEISKSNKLDLVNVDMTPTGQAPALSIQINESVRQMAISGEYSEDKYLETVWETRTWRGEYKNGE